MPSTKDGPKKSFSISSFLMNEIKIILPVGMILSKGGYAKNIGNFGMLVNVYLIFTTQETIFKKKFYQKRAKLRGYIYEGIEP